MNTDARELELKYALTNHEDVVRLAASLGEPHAVFEQSNIYFDTAGRALHRQGAMLRVREVEGRAVVTLKNEATLKDGYLQCREREAQLAADVWESIRSGALSLENAQGVPIQEAMGLLEEDAQLVILGTMKNVRRVYRLSTGFTLELDQTRMPDGRVDGELEVETDEPERAREEIESLLARYDIPWRHQEKTKYARFLEAMERGGTDGFSP